MKIFNQREAFTPEMQYKAGSIYRFCHERRNNEAVISNEGIPPRLGFAAMDCL
jgi:hypothetical protein